MNMCVDDIIVDESIELGKRNPSYNYDRRGVMPLAILPILKGKEKKNEYVTMLGVDVKITSDRYNVFKNSLTCTCCGITGKYFAIERIDGNDKYHLNLYAIDKTGVEVLMTKDHIYPLSRGGKNHISNYQIMCVNCNTLKGYEIW